MKEKTQIFIIHGGMTFKSKKDYLEDLKNKTIYIEKMDYWAHEFLDAKLGKDFDIIRPKMPLKENAKYAEWKIFFDKHIPFFKDNVILIGTSLGGIFLAKYLSENILPNPALSVYLVTPPFDGSLSEEDLAGGFKLKKGLTLIEKNCKNVTLCFSEDDNIVPVAHADKYKKKLKNANIFIYKNRNGHFIVPEFPELVKMIKKDIENI